MAELPSHDDIVFSVSLFDKFMGGDKKCRDVNTIRN